MSNCYSSQAEYDDHSFVNGLCTDCNAVDRPGIKELGAQLATALRQRDGLALERDACNAKNRQLVSESVGWKLRAVAAEKHLADAVGYIERNSSEGMDTLVEEVESEPVLAILRGQGNPVDISHVRCDCMAAYGAPPHCHLCQELAQGPFLRGQYGHTIAWPCGRAAL